MSVPGVRRARRRFPVGASPTRRPLQPEAIGAVMEVTKWLKPSISVSRRTPIADIHTRHGRAHDRRSLRTHAAATFLLFRYSLRFPGVGKGGRLFCPALRDH